MTNRAAGLVALVTALASAAACGSSSDDNANAAGTAGSSTAGTAPEGGTAPSGGKAGTAGHGGTAAGSGGGSTNGGTAGAEAANGGAAGSTNAHAGSGGLSGAGGLAGSAANAGRDEGGASAGGAGGVSGAGDESAAGNGGEAGALAAGPPEYMYVSTVLGGVSAFSIDPASGKPSLLAGSPVDVGPLIYAEVVDPSGRFLYLLDQAGKLSAYRIGADGALPTTAAFSTPTVGGADSLALDPAGRFAYVGTESGTQPVIQIFRLDAVTGEPISSGEPLQLSGSPAYVAVDPTGHFAYVTESAAGGIWAYQIDPTTGALTQVDGSPFGVAKVFHGAIAFKPDGAFLFTSGNGLNAFAIESTSGKLDLIEGSPFSADIASDPSATNLAVDPSGRFLYATEFFPTERLFAFSIAANGKLSLIDGFPTAAAEPYSVAVDPSGHFVYVAEDDGQVAGFAVNSATGKLRAVDGSPFDHGGLQPELAFATAH